MNILFIHQNFPAQYRHVALSYARESAHGLVAIGKTTAGRVRGVRNALYSLREASGMSSNPFVRDYESKVRHGQAVFRVASALKQKGYRPDVIVAHPGWGEDMYVNDVFPGVPRLLYAEFFYHALGADVNFDPEFPGSEVDNARVRSRNAAQLVSLESADWGLSPTQWQRAQYPEFFRSRISVLHDGIDTDAVAPDSAARWRLADGRELTRDDEVVTYAVRNLEPYRGIHHFLRAARLILERRPNAQILVAGGDEVSYGRRLPEGKTYRELFLEEAPIDSERIHFLGRLPYGEYLKVLQVSRAHVYLTVPFVLSWSMLEAMACECLIIGSATPPVTEVLADGKNGLLADFFSPEEIAVRVGEVLAAPEKFDAMRSAARQTIIDRFALGDLLPRHRLLIDSLARGETPEA
jgi:glycosyltransferase involved in cell wall biosynthesis